MAVRIYDAEKDASKEESLWPEQRSWDWLMRKKRNMPPAFYNAQYRNDPSGLRGARYDSTWLQYYTSATLPPFSECVGVQGGDPATSERSTSNYFGHCTAMRHESTGVVYVLDFTYGHIPAPDHLKFMETQYRIWGSKGLRIGKVILEEGGPQQATTQSLIAKTRMSLNMPVETVKPFGSKEQRFDAIMPFIRNSTVLFKGERQGGEVVLSTQDGFKEFGQEYARFPRGGRDDVLDALWIVVQELASHIIAAGIIDKDEGGDIGGEKSGRSEYRGMNRREIGEIKLAEYEERVKGRSTARDRVIGAGRMRRRGMFHE